MSYDQFLKLLLKEKSGDVSPEEREGMNRILRNNPGYYDSLSTVDQIYEVSLNDVEEIDKAYVQERWEEMVKKIHNRQTVERDTAVEMDNF